VSARAPATGLVPVMRPDRRAIITVTAGSASAGISRWKVSTGSQTTVPACLRASWISSGARFRKSAPTEETFLLNFWCMALCLG
jgi:hypothetical protein